jgi:hypothetical protein
MTIGIIEIEASPSLSVVNLSFIVMHRVTTIFETRFFYPGEDRIKGEDEENFFPQL